MDYINNVVKIYDKVSRDIALWLQYLQDEKLKKIQQF